MVLDLLLPPPHVLERLGVRDIVHQDDSVTALVEDACYVSERFLACCVPYLQLNQMLLVYAHQIIAEFDTNRDIVLVIELALHEPHEYGGFADSGVANDDDFEEAVVIHLLLVVYRDQFVV